MLPTEFQKNSLLISFRERLCAKYLKACDRSSAAWDDEDEVRSYDTVEELMTSLNSDEPLELDKADFWRKVWLLRLMKEEGNARLFDSIDIARWDIIPVGYWTED